jgi:hypothetical protein
MHDRLDTRTAIVDIAEGSDRRQMCRILTGHEKAPEKR